MNLRRGSTLAEARADVTQTPTTIRTLRRRERLVSRARDSLGEGIRRNGWNGFSVCLETFSCALEDNFRRLGGGSACPASGVAVIEEGQRTENHGSPADPHQQLVTITVTLEQTAIELPPAHNCQCEELPVYCTV
jgi:hypothetical protein